MAHSGTVARDSMKTARHCNGGSFLVQGRAQMPMGSNRLKFSSSSRKRSSVKSENRPGDVAILSMAVDAQPLFQSRVPGLLSGRRISAVDDVFHTLLSEANQELASLLQEVRTKARGTSLGDARSQQVSELIDTRGPLCRKVSTNFKRSGAILPLPTSSQVCATVAVLWPWQNAH